MVQLQIWHLSITGSPSTDPGKVEAYFKANWLDFFKYLVKFQ